MTNTSKGLTLITVLVYVTLLALIAVLLTRIATSFIRANTEAQLTGEVIDSSQRSLALITQEIQEASGVYTPTSILGSHPGQLSLATTHNLPTDEAVTYVDFYVDDEHLYVKREGAAPALVTSERVKVENLTFTHLYPTSDHSAVRIAATFTADVPGADTQTRTSISLTSTVSLRNY